MKAFLLAALLTSTCELGPFPKPPPEPEPPSPWDSGKAGSAPVDDTDPTSPCGRACAKLKKMGCPEAEPTAAGASCAAVCENVESSGVVSMSPGCVARAESCSIAKACAR